MIHRLIRLPLVAAAVGILLVGLAGCGGKSVDHSAKTAELLSPFEGNWRVIAMERDGKKLSEVEFSAYGATVKDGEMALADTDGPKRPGAPDIERNIFSQKYALQVDATKPAGEVDLAHADGDRVGEIRPALYAFEGDQLKLCVGKTGGQRPTELIGGETNTLLVLKRMESK